MGHTCVDSFGFTSLFDDDNIICRFIDSKTDYMGHPKGLYLGMVGFELGVVGCGIY